MPCYFHLVNGRERLADEDVIAVTDLEVAHAEALKAIEELREENAFGLVMTGWSLAVADPAVRPLLALARRTNQPDVSSTPACITQERLPVRYQRKQPRRGPRESEIEFLRELACGPRAVRKGPLGLCLKRGWCARTPSDGARSSDTTGAVLYTITPEGLEALRQATERA
jgi:hypothetical protein